MYYTRPVIQFVISVWVPQEHERLSSCSSWLLHTIHDILRYLCRLGGLDQIPSVRCKFDSNSTVNSSSHLLRLPKPLT